MKISKKTVVLKTMKSLVSGVKFNSTLYQILRFNIILRVG